MAVTKILARHARLDLAINYAVNPDKTDEEVLTAYLNCDKGHACHQMLATKEAKNNRDGVQYYHIIQSFKPGEITPELALEIAQAFAKEHLADYEVVIGVHVDKEHIHAHMIFNSVNQVTGRKYHSNAKSYYQQIRTISDKLCREHGLSVIMEGKPSKAVSYIEWLRQSKGQPTFRSMLEADLREAIADANDLGHFFLLMEHKGYEIHHGNRLGFRLRGQERFMYPERKNAAFSEENIERTIAGNLAEIEAGTRPALLPRPKPQPYRPHPKDKGFLALYYHYCYLLGRIEKRQYPPRMTPHLRRELMKAETYKARLKFLQENSISTADDLTACMHQAESTVTQLAKQRTILNVRKKKRKKLFDALAAEEALAMSKALYEEGLSGMESEYAQYVEAKATLDTCGISRQALTEEKADIYEQLAQLNKQIRAERKKIKLCREIADSAAVMQRDVAAQEKSRHEKESSQTRDHPSYSFLVKPVLKGISQVLQFPEQPHRQHRQAERADEERENEDDDTVRAVDGKEDDRRQNRKHGPCQCENTSGHAEQERRKMHHQNQREHDRSEQDFQKQPHGKALLFSFFPAYQKILPFARMRTEQMPHYATSASRARIVFAACHNCSCRWSRSSMSAS